MIRGVHVPFPFIPYPCQIDLMTKTMEAMQTKRNALLESPTGTGKTACMLCSTLAWQRHKIAHPSPIEPQPILHTSLLQPPSQQPLGSTHPIIVYAARTHAQLEQVLKELQRTAFASTTNTVVLASRENYCQHPQINKLKGTEQIAACKSTCKAKACTFREATHQGTVASVLAQVWGSTRSRGNNNNNNNTNTTDIEDLTTKAISRRMCPYFVSRDEAVLDAAHLILMPYSYLVDAATGDSLELPWNRAVVVVDEAHNIESVCEEASSFSLTSKMLAQALSELDRINSIADNMMMDGLDLLAGGGGGDTVSSSSGATSPLKSDQIMGIKKVVLHLEVELTTAVHTTPFSMATSVTTAGAATNNPTDEFERGGIVFSWFEKAGVHHGSFTELLEMLDRAQNMVNGRNVPGIVGIFRAITRAFGLGQSIEQAKCTANEFFRVGKRETEDGGWEIDFWCMSAAMAMRHVTERGVRSIIMVSGTLAPLDAFATSVGIHIPLRLENPHVIASSQILVGVLKHGPDSQPLRLTYDTLRGDDAFKSRLGMALLNTTRLVPDGVLVFFPSYAVLDTLVTYWKTHGNLWDGIADGREIIIENNKSPWTEAVERYDTALAHGRGALFFCVCRGRLSEGMDFKDARARAVFVLGIPYPSYKDPRVVCKRKYLDDKCHRKGTVISGKDWYDMAAFRSINQAVGRVIRHVKDFGVVVLMDERLEFCKPNLSLWLRPHFKVWNNFGQSVAGIGAFFRENGDGLTRKVLGGGSAAVAVVSVGNGGNNWSGGGGGGGIMTSHTTTTTTTTTMPLVPILPPPDLSMLPQSKRPRETSSSSSQPPLVVGPAIIGAAGSTAAHMFKNLMSSNDVVTPPLPTLQANDLLKNIKSSLTHEKWIQFKLKLKDLQKIQTSVTTTSKLSTQEEHALQGIVEDLGGISSERLRQTLLRDLAAFLPTRHGDFILGMIGW